MPTAFRLIEAFARRPPETSPWPSRLAWHDAKVGLQAAFVHLLYNAFAILLILIAAVIWHTGQPYSAVI